MNIPPKISIIIPCFNADRFIGRCLDSVFSQRYKDYEVIVIDDGSTDNTFVIVSKLVKYKTNATLIKKKNSGVSDARNIGLTIAQGEYIVFIDADDYILDGYFAFIEAKTKEQQADCLILNHFVSGKRYRKKTLRKNYAKEELMWRNDAIRCFLNGGITNVPWDKVFKRSIISNIKFPTGISVGEDALFTTKALLKSNTVLLTHQAFYMYMHDTNGITQTGFTHKKLEDITFVVQQIEKELIEEFDEGLISFMGFNQMLPYLLNIKPSISMPLSFEEKIGFNYIKKNKIKKITNIKIQKIIAFLFLYVVFLIKGVFNP